MEEDKIDTFERRKKIVEFMLELRHLFALMVASQRKYVDPTKAVEILRGSIGKKYSKKRSRVRTPCSSAPHTPH